MNVRVVCDRCRTPVDLDRNPHTVWSSPHPPESQHHRPIALVYCENCCPLCHRNRDQLKVQTHVS